MNQKNCDVAFVRCNQFNVSKGEVISNLKEFNNTEHQKIKYIHSF